MIAEIQTPHRRRRTVHLATQFFSSIYLWCTVCLAWGALLAWIGRNEMNPDAISYLDIASQALAHGPSALAHPYWSPAYPALIALVLRVFRPAPLSEFAAVHALNFCIFALALLAFAFFLNRLIGLASDASGERDLRRSLVPLGFALFLWFATEFNTLGALTPDLLMTAAILLAAGLGCRIATSPSAWTGYALLGAILGAAFYVKSVMLPLGLGLLAILWIFRPSPHVRRTGVMLAAGVFLLTTLPLVSALSFRAGRLSYGEAGGLNYLWYTNYRDLCSYNGWEGRFGSAYHQLAHPPPKLLNQPLTIEFSRPLPGTYPLWFDPSYWWAGVSSRFDLKQQIAVIRENLLAYAIVLRQIGALFMGIVMLVLFPRRNRIAPPSSRHLWWTVLWALGALAGYALVNVQLRFLAGFMILFWMAVYAWLLPRVEARARAAILIAIIASLFIPSGIRARVAWLQSEPEPAYVTMTHALHQMGLNPGDSIALVGSGFTAYYARPAGVRIVAQIQNEDEFRRLNSRQLTELAARLKAIGVKAVVAAGAPASGSPRGLWREVRGAGAQSFSIWGL